MNRRIAQTAEKAISERLRLVDGKNPGKKVGVRARIVISKAPGGRSR